MKRFSSRLLALKSNGCLNWPIKDFTHSYVRSEVCSPSSLLAIRLAVCLYLVIVSGRSPSDSKDSKKRQQASSIQMPLEASTQCSRASLDASRRLRRPLSSRRAASASFSCESLRCVYLYSSLLSPISRSLTLACKAVASLYSLRKASLGLPSSVHLIL